MQRKISRNIARLIFIILIGVPLIWSRPGIVQSVESTIDPPRDVTPFLNGYAKAIEGGQLSQIMSCYSDRFMSNGRGKQATERFWTMMLKRGPVNEFRVVLNHFKQYGDKAEVDGTVVFNGRRTPLQIRSIIKEDGQWRWYGRPIREIRVAKLHLSFGDPRWNGKTVPQGQQCLRFGGRPFTPPLKVKDIPAEANAIITEYSDRDWPPMDNGGHGRIGYTVTPGCKEVTVPSIPGHTFNLPPGFFLVEAHRGQEWDKAGAYMPPCSGGRGNRYYVTVKAIRRTGENDLKGQVLAIGTLELGRY